MDLKSTYNQIAKDWGDEHVDDTWWCEGVDKFVSFLPKGGTVLDVGCGVGQKSEYLVKKGLKVTAFDFSDEMVKLAKSKVPGVKFLLKDISKPLNFEVSFDGILAQAVLLHTPKKEIVKVIKNVVSPLKAGGYFYVAVKESRVGQSDEQTLREGVYGSSYERFFSFFTQEEMEDYLKKIGLKIVYSKIIPKNQTNWVQIIAKK